ncbi:MAG: hypothetical protein UR28_C0042G0023 [Candidatus Peregrinibacteria bacterium GW2011_GWF2_33_10]|nr:MAG: hypothetical protein UR28_C0042G0023 [Candidatus Peregrinibacteria bacterium GW2011_GWF2_33_10]OGJ45677.1 MAG: hypothetical protein A2263_01810 [Candidatus Peregrinibacteria bacterium RIFOXYA2_FULL_33_21]OGJ46508.1 MAG: hypothetical protein A2272_02460 [Candidatus Peregrinibacteria bacterium RIFOXYA12_FULL_33_12]OGJ51252.1 MAG: hypothetical protein A2307_00240 [Candidatus Peregrinibacteria bacterium RIFOXYB2_FULL_33_20]
MDNVYLPKPEVRKFIYRKKRLSQLIKEGYRMLIATIAVLSFVFTFCYIRIQTQSTVLGYYLSEIKTENEVLKNKNLDLTQKVLEAQSMKSLDGQTFSSRMYATTQEDIAYAKGDTDLAVLPFRLEHD